MVNLLILLRRQVSANSSTKCIIGWLYLNIVANVCDMYELS